MCAPRHAAVVRPRERKKSADRRRRILISRLLIIRASVPRRKSPFPAYFKGFPAVSLLIPPYPAFLKYPVSPHLAFAAANDDLTVKDVGIESDSEGQCIGVQKGNEDFVAYLNEKIAEMQEQGLIDQYVAEAQTLAGIE